MKRQALLLTFSALVLGAIGFAAFNWQGLGAFRPSQNIPAGDRSDFGLMAEAWNTIERVYVDRAAVKPTPMTYGAISGMVESLGDTGHSTFLTPEMIKEERDYIRGEYKGIGIEVRLKNKRVVILAPMDGSPAQKAGLRPGDVILRVDGEDVSGWTLSQVAKKILGPKGTDVTLTIMDPKTGGLHQVTLTRTEITVENVTWVPLPGTTSAHLRIAGFSHGVTNDLRKALSEIQRENLNGLVFDLRNDPGGLLDEAVATASQFLTGGNALLEKNAQGKVTPVPVESGGVAPDLPMVVLINGGTASSAEIVAGALQDAHRAELVGETTFGTGTVLEQFPLSDGSALLLAVMEWLTPDGNTIWHKGIAPDVTVGLPAGVVPSFPLEERGMTAEQLKGVQDNQLLRALSLLNQK